MSNYKSFIMKIGFTEKRVNVDFMYSKIIFKMVHHLKKKQNVYQLKNGHKRSVRKHFSYKFFIIVKLISLLSKRNIIVVGEILN